MTPSFTVRVKLFYRIVSYCTSSVLCCVFRGHATSLGWWQRQRQTRWL